MQVRVGVHACADGSILRRGLGAREGSRELIIGASAPDAFISHAFRYGACCSDASRSTAEPTFRSAIADITWHDESDEVALFCGRVAKDQYQSTTLC